MLVKLHERKLLQRRAARCSSSCLRPHAQNTCFFRYQQRRPGATLRRAAGARACRSSRVLASIPSAASVSAALSLPIGWQAQGHVTPT